MTSTIVKTKQAQQAMNALQRLHDYLGRGDTMAVETRHRLSDVILTLIEAGFPRPIPKKARKIVKPSPVSEPKGPDRGDPLAGGIAS